jgi:hypothetical protein
MSYRPTPRSCAVDPIVPARRAPIKPSAFSKNLSFDEAFAQALANLPPLELPGADVLARVQVMEIGGLFGGIAGFRGLFVPCLPHP